MMQSITKLANLLKFILIMSWVLFPMDHSLLAYTHLRVNIKYEQYRHIFVSLRRIVAKILRWHSPALIALTDSTLRK